MMYFPATVHRTASIATATAIPPNSSIAMSMLVTSVCLFRCFLSLARFYMLIPVMTPPNIVETIIIVIV